MPGFGDLLARTMEIAVRSPVTRSIRASTLPPVALRPSRRALMTLVLLATSRSLREEALDVRERAVLDHVLRDVQKTRCSAVFKGILGDELRRELEIEIG